LTNSTAPSGVRDRNEGGDPVDHLSKCELVPARDGRRRSAAGRAVADEMTGFGGWHARGAPIKGVSPQVKSFTSSVLTWSACVHSTPWGPILQLDELNVLDHLRLSSWALLGDPSAGHQDREARPVQGGAG